jgi:hypothetical protein
VAYRNSNSTSGQTGPRPEEQDQISAEAALAKERARAALLAMMADLKSTAEFSESWKRRGTAAKETQAR